MTLVSKITLAAAAAALTGTIAAAPAFANPVAAHTTVHVNKTVRVHGFRVHPGHVRGVRTAHVRVGVNVRALPAGHVRVRVGNTRYFYHGGVYYRPARTGYVVVSAPLGARVAVLPAGYVSFYVGPVRYYHVHGAYYIYDRSARTYVVVKEPDGINIDDTDTDAADSEFERKAAHSPVVVVFPANGQSDEQMGKDRYDCHLWSSEESGFDPLFTDQASTEQKDIYRRGLEACLTAKGYTVG